MQCTVGAGRIPVDLENGHDSLTRVFPFTGRVPRSRNCVDPLAKFQRPHPSPFHRNNRAIYAVIVPIFRALSRASLPLLPPYNFSKEQFSRSSLLGDYCTVVAVSNAANLRNLVARTNKAIKTDRSSHFELGQLNARHTSGVCINCIYEYETVLNFTEMRIESHGIAHCKNR